MLGTNKTKQAFLLSFNQIYSLFSKDKMARFPIEHYQIGQRLDRYLKKSPIGWISGQKHLRKRDIIIQKADGTTVNNSDYRLQQGDSLLISPLFKSTFAEKNQLDESRLIPRQQASRILQKMIVFDNENVTVVNKKNGFSVQGGLNSRTNLFSLMSSKYKKQLIHITHRLDKGTSGLVIFAKSKQMAQLIQMSMQQKNAFSKYYMAQTQGSKLVQKQDYIRCNIQWTGKNKARLCSQTQESSKDCITYYVPIQGIKLKNQKNKQAFRNLLGVKLLTGRKHQIRCHFSNYLEQPILNDTKYNGQKISFATDKKQQVQASIKEQQEEQKLFLHAFGLCIFKKQLIEKIISNNRYYLNEDLGSISTSSNSVLFTAKIPQFWLNLPENSEFRDTFKMLKLDKLATIIESMQKESQRKLPKKRNVTTIS